MNLLVHQKKNQRSENWWHEFCLIVMIEAGFVMKPGGKKQSTAQRQFFSSKTFMEISWNRGPRTS